MASRRSWTRPNSITKSRRLMSPRRRAASGSTIAILPSLGRSRIRIVSAVGSRAGPAFAHHPRDVFVNADEPLVTLGVPVRNGAATLAAAPGFGRRPELSQSRSHYLGQCVHRCDLRHRARLRGTLPFVRVVRHDTPLTAIDNFMFVLNEARGEFFACVALRRHPIAGLRQRSPSRIPRSVDRSGVRRFVCTVRRILAARSPGLSVRQ